MVRSIDGCWTCRLRRKKCDEAHPVCLACSALHIKCYYDQDKPEWMDGGEKQKEMAKQIKREVKRKAPFRFSRSFSHRYRDGDSEPVMGLLTRPNAVRGSESRSPVFLLPPATPERDSRSSKKSAGEVAQLAASSERREPPDTEYIPATTLPELDPGLMMYYFDYFFPFLFPLYRPPLSEGGRSWVFDLVIQSQAVQQTTLCLSAYFFSLTFETASPGHEECKIHSWKKLLEHSSTAFRILEQELRILNEGGVQDHLPEAMRIMGSIIQLQRFEIAACSFENCQVHLSAAISLFRQMLDGAYVTENHKSRAGFHAVMNRLGRSSSNWAAETVWVPSPDQAAFRFFSALLIVDDIISSTALEKSPALRDYHNYLLLDDCNATDEKAPINIESIIGCQNWLMVQIGEIAALDAWKKQHKKAGDLDVMELVVRAKAIQDILQSHLARLQAATTTVSTAVSSVTDIFATYNNEPLILDNDRKFVTHIWAYAAVIYLFVVVSGWQPSNADVRYHVKSTIDLLVRHNPSPALLRTLVWPFCVVGCLAEQPEQNVLCDMVDKLRPPAMFGTMHKAFKIMENVWRRTDTLNTDWDLAASFRSLEHFVLLV